MDLQILGITGGFVVLCILVLSWGSKAEEIESLKAKVRKLIEIIDPMKAAVLEAEKEKDQARLRANKLIAEKHKEVLKVNKAMLDIYEKNNELEARLRSISQEAWNFIHAEDRESRRIIEATLSAQRIKKDCTCQENPNCYRCSGNGYYFVDGHGAIIEGISGL